MYVENDTLHKMCSAATFTVIDIAQLLKYMMPNRTEMEPPRISSTPRRPCMLGFTPRIMFTISYHYA